MDTVTLEQGKEVGGPLPAPNVNALTELERERGEGVLVIIDTWNAHRKREERERESHIAFMVGWFSFNDLNYSLSAFILTRGFQ